MQKLVKLMVCLCALGPAILKAEFSSSQRRHSMFNAHLLNENEVLFDLVPFTNLNVGVTKNNELGVSSALYLASIPNIFFKHRMFTVGRAETSFSSFSLFVPRIGANNAWSFLSLHGLVSSYEASSQLVWNLGLYRTYYLAYGTDKSKTLGDVHFRNEAQLISGLVGFDYYMSPQWALSAFALPPLYMDLDITSDLGDATISAFGNRQTLYKAHMFIANASITRSWRIFNLQVGLLHVSPTTLPYISLIWRLR